MQLFLRAYLQKRDGALDTWSSNLVELTQALDVGLL